ncbi:MAG TPA: hypothetical protein VIT45_04895 [Allosphingosinicella sp.]
MSFPISYDADRNLIVLDGAGGASIMVAVLLKAKFGEAYDSETLLHSDLADLARQLWAASDLPRTARGEAFTNAQLWLIADRVYADSPMSGWWSMSEMERRKYLEDAAAPHLLSEEQIEFLFEAIDSKLFRSREIVEAAEQSGRPEQD